MTKIAASKDPVHIERRNAFLKTVVLDMLTFLMAIAFCFLSVDGCAGVADGLCGALGYLSYTSPMAFILMFGFFKVLGYVAGVVVVLVVALLVGLGTVLDASIK